MSRDWTPRHLVHSLDSIISTLPVKLLPCHEFVPLYEIDTMHHAMKVYAKYLQPLFGNNATAAHKLAVFKLSSLNRPQESAREASAQGSRLVRVGLIIPVVKPPSECPYPHTRHVTGLQADVGRPTMIWYQMQTILAGAADSLKA